MTLKSPFLLPWVSEAGDFAPAWSALDGDGVKKTAESWPGTAQLLVFVPPDESAAGVLDALGVHAPLVNDLGCLLCAFTARPAPAAQRRFPVLYDEDGKVARAFCLPRAERANGTPPPRAVLVDAEGRVLESIPLALSEAGAQAAIELARRHAPFTALRAPSAPLLHIPGLFTPQFCRELITAFEIGETVDGTVLRIYDGKPVHIVDAAHKQRRDLRLASPLKDRVWELLKWRLVPAAKKAFHFPITRFEYLQIGRYRASDGGHFRAHRDDDHAGNGHRRFALTVNLNDDYEGGELRFHEAAHSVRPAVGGAVLFSCSLLHEAAVVTAGERFVLVGMFWGERQVPLYERNLAPRNTVAVPDARVLQRQQLIESARALRQVAGDVAVFGAKLPVDIEGRLKRLHRELLSLREDLVGLRAPHLDAQLQTITLPPSGLKLHLGCGAHRLPGWLNIDTAGGDLAMDLRWRLPLLDGAARYVFASHVLEHLYRQSELPALLREIHRVLAPGGVLRVIVPDIEKCLRAYGHDAQFFEDRKKTWAWARHCKTDLDHFLHYAGAGQALESFDGHKYGYDWETLSLALQEAGFSSVVRSEFMASEHAPLRIDEESHNAIASSRGVYYSLFVEATR